MTWGSITDGRITACGSGGSSDCLALRLRPGNLIELSSSLDEMPEHRQEHPNSGRFELEPHELYQFVYGFLKGALPMELQAAMAIDMQRHPELPAIPAEAFDAVKNDGYPLPACAHSVTEPNPVTAESAVS